MSYKTNNTVENLYYDTHKNNVRHAVDCGLIVCSQERKLNPILAKEIRSRYTEGSCTQKELAAEYGVHHNTIQALLSGKSWRWVV